MTYGLSNYILTTTHLMFKLGPTTVTVEPEYYKQLFMNTILYYFHMSFPLENKKCGTLTEIHGN